ncbi:allophanate hydrolase [Streptomyces drozdowiczii]|uniref:Allophanate hydrolase n=1 Tax=Streptomyces drozdowiczii TaxID=202862 RepID=A0ABY6PZX1_9ACTN|nr:allophanate hydrolase [Streptomyces drozdowiczii]MCX0242521.1 allophanate hydrolase [Streptomyces drozdowiczii]UZK57436.1 allophanate hydrolase [Streptomyces drozdowiczii]
MTQSCTARVTAAYRRIAETDRPEVWILLRPEEEVLAEATALDARLAAGEPLPLAGVVFAVKDNIDVADLPTTAGCPGFAYHPDASATAVQRLLDAGALLLGKTNLDQFATGLVGTRSPYGAVRNALLPEKISGGSSSGSAVAVALGIVDIALGTDTAGSGRVPAALNGIVGIKPTLGIVPTTGVIPAARSYDAVTVFARTLTEAQTAVGFMTGADRHDPRSRTWPDDVRLAAPARPRIAVPRDEDLAPLSPGGRAAFAAAVKQLEAAGATTAVVDVSPLLEAARLLYDGALVAERYASVGDFIADNPSAADPTVARIILAAASLPAHALATDQERLDRYRVHADGLLSGYDALVLPTTTGHPDIAEVLADPVVLNSRMGTYTNFVNLLDMAAVAVPAGEADGSPFGVSVITRAFRDQPAIDIAALLTGEQAPGPLPDGGIDLAVFGAHLTGQPLNHQLTDSGARYAGEVTTAACYRLTALATAPPKPGLVRVGPGDGAAITGERWTLSPAALGRFLAALPAPMSLGRVEVAGGSWVLGFQCDPHAAAGGTDITEHGGWRAYLEATGEATTA